MAVKGAGDRPASSRRPPRDARRGQRHSPSTRLTRVRRVVVSSCRRRAQRASVAFVGIGNRSELQFR
jgi:hypothetical protein